MFETINRDKTRSIKTETKDKKIKVKQDRHLKLFLQNARPR